MRCRNVVLLIWVCLDIVEFVADDLPPPDNHGGRPTKQRYWIVVSQTQVTTTGSVSYDPASSDINDPYASTLSGIWTTYIGRDMKVRVYGRYKYPQQ